ncbi:MAG: hypothetical protein K1X74_02115 [Pirellulales bacterium]|nr:hypothetical protein [Pirellulales bacterium]
MPSAPDSAGHGHGSRRALDALVLVLALFLTLPWEAYSPGQRVSTYRLLDRSWECGVVRMWGEGRLAGRDLAFPYGPLYPWIHSCGGLLAQADAATILRWHQVPQTVLSIACVWWVFGLAGVRGTARRVLFGAWVVLVAAPLEYEAVSLKPVLALAVVGGGAAALERALCHGGDARRLAAIVATWAPLSPLAALYSFDLGVFAAAGLALVAVGVLIVDPRRRQVVLPVSTALFALAVGAAAFFALFQALPRWRHYLGETWELASLYGTTMAEPASDGELGLIALIVVGSAAALIAALAMWRGAAARAPGVLVLAGLAALSLVMVRYAITRSDFLHFYRALVPGVLLVGCLWPGHLGCQGVHGPGARLATRVLPLVGLAPFALLQTTWITWQLRLAALSALALAPAKIDYRDDALQRAVAEVRALPETSIAVWPYGALIGQLAGKSNPLYTVQAADLAVGPLEERTLERLAPTEPPVLVYRSALRIGSVAGYARNPRLFRHWLEDYELAAPLHDAFAVLRRRADGAGRLQAVELPLPPGGARFEPRPDIVLRLSLDGSDVRASELIALELRVVPRHAWGGKPGRLIAVLVISDGRQVAFPLLIVPDGQPQPALVSALDVDDAMFLSAFGPRPWRSTEGVRELLLVWQPLDRLSQRPREIVIDAWSVLRRSDGEPLETPLADQNDPRALQAAFGPFAPAAGALPAVP